MSFINRLFSIRATKAMLTVAFFILLALTIWYFGPFFGFGETRPLENAEPRIILIVLSLLFSISIWTRFPLIIMSLLALCCAVWIMGPYILTGESYPLKSVNSRVIFIGCILLVGLFYGAWKLIVALKKNPKFLDKFIKDETVNEDYNQEEIFSKIQKAQNKIKNAGQNSSRLKRFFLPERFLSDIPWYLVIGTDNAGKTASLLSSGQSFPDPEQLKNVANETIPTTNCECWITNDALFLDTAGKYISHSNDNEWKNILNGIKKYRSMKAINGIIINISVSDVMGRSTADLYALSAKIRARIEDTRLTLGVHFPVYMLVSKVDQLSGFSEYFRVLTEQEREQIWGVSFPYGEELIKPTSNLRKEIDTELALLENRIEEKMTLRQQEEVNLSDRKRMYSFPQDFRILSKAISETLQNIFFTSRYDENKGSTNLRGLYFLSSKQPADIFMLNNNTLVNKCNNHVHQRTSNAVESVKRESKNSDFLFTENAYDRHYFLKNLFSDIIVKDLYLVRHNLSAESKYRFKNILIHFSCILLTVWLANGLYNSHYNNKSYLNHINEKVISLEENILSFEKTGNVALIPVLLSMAQYLPEYETLNVDNPPLNFRFGQYTGWDITSSSVSLYQYFLQKLLLPNVQNEAREKLQKTLTTENNNEIYAALKTYLMLNGTGKLNKEYLISAITQDWDDSGKISLYIDKEIFIDHLTNLFDLADWRHYAQPIDNDMVVQARTILGRFPLSDRLYERIKLIMKNDAPENLTLSNMMDGKSSKIFTMDESGGDTNSIPGLFTYSGYHQIFKKKISSLVRKLSDEDNWIMEGKHNSSLAEFSSKRLHSESGLLGSAMLTAAKRLDPVKQDIMQRYFDEYTQRWSEFLRHIRLSSNGPQRRNGQLALSFDIYLLRTVVASDSPLVRLAQRAVQETTLSALHHEELLDTRSPNTQVVQNAIKANNLLIELEKKRVREGVDRHFSSLREFVTGSVHSDEKTGSTATVGGRLRSIMGILHDQYTLLVISDNALKNGNMPALSEAGLKISAESQTWPDPLRNIIEPLLDGAYKKVNHLVISESNKNIGTSLGKICRNTLEGRYPFATSPQEVRLRDFERFFAPGGLVDTFFMKNLADKVNTSVKPWRYKRERDEQDSTTLKTFEQAQAIQDIFFQNGESKKMSVNFTISVPYMAPAITQLSMNFDGSTLDYTHGPVTPASFTWPGHQTGSLISISAQPGMAEKSSSMTFAGPWAIFHWIDSVKKVEHSLSANPVLVFSLDNRRVDIEASGITYDDRLMTSLLRHFRCP